MTLSERLTAISKQIRTWGVAEFLVIFFIIVAAYLRLWNLPATLMFQGDQGRDVLIVADIFKQGDLVFIGPVTSVGNMYLGPLYYYFMVPFLWLSYPSPVGPAYAIALLSILTTFLTYYLGKDIIGKTGALFATFFFALSNTAVVFARFSWNPNPAPLFGLLMVWGSYKAWTKNAWYWLVVSICFSILIQLHYLTLLALPAAGLIWLYQGISLFRTEKRSPKKIKRFVLSTLASIGVFLVSLTPLLLFDFKHEWLNTQAFVQLVTNKDHIGGELSGLTRLINILKETHGRSMHILFDLFIGQDRTRNTVLVILTLLGMGGLLKTSTGKRQKGYIVLFIFVIGAILGTSIYQHTLFDHYLGYVFALVCLVYGSILAYMLKHRVGLLLIVFFCGFFVWYNAPRYPLWTPGWTIFDMKRTADVIAEQVSPGEKYNIVLLSESKDLYGQNYRYFLSTTETPPVSPDEFAEADKLFIINENQPDIDVTQLPIYEIQTFPNKNISRVYTVENGPNIIMLER